MLESLKEQGSNLMKFLGDMLSERSRVSAMRVMSFTSLLIGGYIAIRGIEKGITDLSGLAILCGVFVGSAFGGKVLQKIPEVREQSDEPTVKTTVSTSTTVKK